MSFCRPTKVGWTGVGGTPGFCPSHWWSAGLCLGAAGSKVAWKHRMSAVAGWGDMSCHAFRQRAAMNLNRSITFSWYSALTSGLATVMPRDQYLLRSW